MVVTVGIVVTIGKRHVTVSVRVIVIIAVVAAINFCNLSRIVVAPTKRSTLHYEIAPSRGLPTKLKTDHRTGLTGQLEGVPDAMRPMTKTKVVVASRTLSAASALNRFISTA